MSVVKRKVESGNSAIDMETARRIKAIRGEQTQAEFAERLGVTQPMISSWEAGREIPSVEMYVRLAKVSRDPDDLIYFLDQTEIGREAIMSVANELLKEKGTEMDDQILATAEARLKERVGDSKIFETEGKVVLVPPFTVGEWAEQASQPRIEVRARLVSNLASTFYLRPWLLPGAHQFGENDVLVIDTSGVSARLLMPFVNKLIVAKFAPRSQRQGPDPYMDGGVSVWPEGLFVRRLRYEAYHPWWFTLDVPEQGHVWTSIPLYCIHPPGCRLTKQEIDDGKAYATFPKGFEILGRLVDWQVSPQTK